ncbi:hypothetical protein RQP46_011321 [Phenoliferia psychrophenolica]
MGAVILVCQTFFAWRIFTVSRGMRYKLPQILPLAIVLFSTLQFVNARASVGTAIGELVPPILMHAGVFVSVKKEVQVEQSEPVTFGRLVRKGPDAVSVSIQLNTLDHHEDDFQPDSPTTSWR